jgi:mono/diheme cytochrome c family protein
MKRSMLLYLGLVLGLALPVVPASAAELTAVERGKRALLGQGYDPPTLTPAAYEKVWQQWGLKEKPAAADYARLFRERYGMHEAPYANDGLPMGMRLMPGALGMGKGIGMDCLLCHGGSIAGKSYVGLPNSTLDYQAFYEEMYAASGKGRRAHTPFRFSNVRGTTEAGAMAVFLLGYRTPNLNLRLTRMDLGLQDELCEDPPAWWLLKKKKTMYHTGSTDTRSVRALMQFMMSPLNFPSAFHDAEKKFTDIREYLLSLEAPRYPLPIDRTLARKGEKIFNDTCARCHGTYGPKGTYPNRIVPIEQIGTDRRRFDGLSRKFGAYFNKSWFAEKYPAVETKGYQAPPLDGIWATAPYFHNGSVPTVYNVLNSKSRPPIYTRSFRTDLTAYDAKKLGWKVEVLRKAPDPATTPPLEFRKVYDTTRPGRGNGGHPFGDRLSDAERWAVIEYLKTL